MYASCHAPRCIVVAPLSQATASGAHCSAQADCVSADIEQGRTQSDTARRSYARSSLSTKCVQSVRVPESGSAGALSAVPRRMSSAATSRAATDRTTATARPTPRVSRSTRRRSASGGGPGRKRERHTEHRDARSAVMQWCSGEGCGWG